MPDYGGGRAVAKAGEALPAQGDPFWQKHREHTPPRPDGDLGAPPGQPQRVTEAVRLAQVPSFKWTIGTVPKLPPISPTAGSEWFDQKKEASQRGTRSPRGTPVTRSPCQSVSTGSARRSSLSPRSPRSSRNSSRGSRARSSPRRTPVIAIDPSPMSARYGDETRIRTAGLRPAPEGVGPNGTLWRGASGRQEKPDIWNPNPAHKTAADLFHTQHLSRLPNPTYDVDGDGVVSTEDLYMASKFDFNGDWILDQDELIALRKKMVNDVVTEYTEQPFAASGKCAEQVKDGRLQLAASMPQHRRGRRRR